MVSFKHQLPNVHLRKDWKRRVKTHFDQPGKKVHRQKVREEKAKVAAPRPASGPLRPIVKCETQRYNMRTRAGRGFNIEELKAVGLTRLYAQTIGIAVDIRRRKKSAQTFEENVKRLKHYMSKLVIIPRVKVAKEGEVVVEAPKYTQVKKFVGYLPAAKKVQTAVIDESLRGVNLAEKLKKYGKKGKKIRKPKEN